MATSSPETLLSKKSIVPRDRLIFPLDVPTNEEAMALVARLGDSVAFYKVGLELIIGGRYLEVVDFLVRSNKKVMLDGKFFDVPETVKAAVRQASKHAITFVTVHANDAMLEAAVEVKGDMQILAVTVLTSLDDGDLKDLGFQCDAVTLVLSRARRALQIGCDGVVSSGLEAPGLRDHCGDKFVIVTPGIRPVKNVDDQKRTVDVDEAFRNGADYIVVGRPIRNAPDPKAAAENVQKRIAALFPS
ncbi:MAG: orotidine-5'-phosphate decarboxylase [Betaproteobacteria bacterium]|nr:orotidine-5'-phosphate decarboxylase [Betaproteobacteria bacterium]